MDRALLKELLTLSFEYCREGIRHNTILMLIFQYCMLNSCFQSFFTTSVSKVYSAIYKWMYRTDSKLPISARYIENIIRMFSLYSIVFNNNTDTPNIMVWYIYLLECKDGSLYTGITNNLEKRMEAQKTGKGSKYVRSKVFKRLLYSIAVSNKREAAKIEYLIKCMKSDDKITYFVKNKQ